VYRAQLCAGKYHVGAIAGGIYSTEVFFCYSIFIKQLGGRINRLLTSINAGEIKNEKI
jgi:hypothetical protein